jgi:hypothetical protein
MEKILAHRFAPFNFSSIPGFPNVVPSLDEWGEYLPIFGKCEEDKPAQHLSEFHELMHQWEIHHEDVLLKMFVFSLAGEARKWYHSLPHASISSHSDFHATFTAYCQEFSPSVLVCHNCSEGYHNSILDKVVSDIGCEDDSDDLDQKPFLSPPHSSASEVDYESDEYPTGGEDSLSELMEQVKYLSAQLEGLKYEDCAEDFPTWEEKDDLSELVEQAFFPTPQCTKLESEDSEEDFPVFKADDLSSSFEEIIEDFLDTLAYSPDEPAVSELNNEVVVVEEDCSLFLHEISHDVFTFGVETEERGIFPLLQDGEALFPPDFDDYLEEEQQNPTSPFTNQSSQPTYDNYESESELDMLDFQEQVAEPCPLLTKENYHEEISHLSPSGDAEQYEEEQNLSGGVVYDEYKSDPGESQEEEKEPEEQSSLCSEPISEQLPPEISEPTSVIHPPMLIRDIQPRVNNCVAKETVCRPFPRIGHSFDDPVSKYMSGISLMLWSRHIPSQLQLVRRS